MSARTGRVVLGPGQVSGAGQVLAGKRSEVSGAPEKGFNDSERKLLASAERYLRRGRELLGWWRQSAPEDAFDSRFELALNRDRSGGSFGFTGVAEVEGERMPVMGNQQTMFYDRPKAQPADAAASVRWCCRQLREFALRYFMRISDFRQPATLPCSDCQEPPPFLRPLSWHEGGEGEISGFGYSQLFFKRQGEERIHRFPAEEQFKIIDFRDLVEHYEWVIAKVRIFDFQFVLAPGGNEGAHLVVPLEESSHVILHRDYLLDQAEPEPGVLGRYGFGYAFLPNPRADALAYGPGRFAAAFQSFAFEVGEDGEIEARMCFTADRPRQVLRVSMNPMDWGLRMAEIGSLGMANGLFEPLRQALGRLPSPRVDVASGYIGLANLMTMGAAGKELCISKDQLERIFLAQHFQQHYHVMASSLVTWRQVADWCREEEIPVWMVRGSSI